MAELIFNATTVKQMSGDGIYDFLEINGTPNKEIFRVKSSSDGDYFYSRKFSKIIGYQAQNHGATFATGVSRDSPRILITNGPNGEAARVTIRHTTTAEFFTIVLFGEH